MTKPRRRRLLLADNSPDYRRSLRTLLNAENYEVSEASSVAEAIAKLAKDQYDLALVDLRLTDDTADTDFSGMDVVKKATELGIACVIITLFPSVEIERLALRSRGAAPLAVDFISKVHGPQAVLDSIGVVLNNLGHGGVASSSGLSIDTKQQLVWNKGEAVEVSKLQYSLIVYLYRQNGAVCTAADIIKAVYNQDIPSELAVADKRLERLVERVREKIEDDPTHPQLLITVHGRGFRLALKR